MQKRFRLASILALLCLICALCLTACKQEFKVVFDANGGEFVSGREVQIVTSAEDITAPVYTRNGYDFDGWDTAIRNIKEDATVKAMWRAKRYDVALSSGEYGAPLQTDSISVTYDSAVSGLPTPVSNNPAYVFGGWVIQDTEKTIANGQIWQEYAQNVTLVATWVKVGYLINYTNMENTYFVDGIGNPIVYDGNSGVITLKNPLKDGVVFMGWSGTDIDGIAREVQIDATDANNLKDRTYEAVFSDSNSVYTLNFQLWRIVRNIKVYIRINNSTANFTKYVLKGDKIDAETWQLIDIPQSPFYGQDKDHYKCEQYYALDKDGNKVVIDENTVFTEDVFGTQKNITVYADILATYSGNVS